MFIGWNIPNSPISVLANHPRPTFLSAEIHPKSQCPFLLYLSLGQVSIAFLGMRDHSLSGAELPLLPSTFLTTGTKQLKQVSTDFVEGFPKQSHTVGSTKGTEFCVKEEDPAQKSLARTFIGILLSILCLFSPSLLPASALLRFWSRF